MFDDFGDLPLHPLAVHAPIVLIPLLILVSFGYAMVVRFRAVTEWAVVLLAVIAPAVTWVTRESGYEMKERLERNGPLPEELAADVNKHADLSYILIWLVAGLAVAAVSLVVSNRVTAPQSPVAIALVVVVIALGVLSAIYLFQTGDLGARMVWEGT